MSDTQLISLRMPKELLAKIDEVTLLEKRSRAQVIVMKLEEQFGQMSLGTERLSELRAGREKPQRGEAARASVATRRAEAVLAEAPAIIGPVAEGGPPAGCAVCGGMNGMHQRGCKRG